MDIVDQLNKLKPEGRSIIFGTAVLMPFFFLTFYLTKSQFFIKEDIIFKIVTCFCFSLGLLYLMTLSDAILRSFLGNVESWYYQGVLRSVLVLFLVNFENVYIEPLKAKTAILIIIVSALILIIVSVFVYFVKTVMCKKLEEPKSLMD